MASTKTHGASGQQIPDTISRSPSQVLTPVAKDGVGEIATKLREIEGIIGHLDGEPSPRTLTPNMGELLQEIAELRKEVKDTKLAQENKIKSLKDEVRHDTKAQIAQSTSDKIKSVIEDTIVSQVNIEMAKWGKKPGVGEFVGALQTMAEENEVLFGEARVQLANSHSRHANSTLDIQTDFGAKLRPIRRWDSRVRENFPGSLRELLSYDTGQLVQLIEEHGLRPLGGHNENLNRFMAFIGVNASIPEQPTDPQEEQLPAYPLGDANRTRDEKDRGGARRSSSASQDSKQNGNSLWSWI